MTSRLARRCAAGLAAAALGTAIAAATAAPASAATLAPCTTLTEMTRSGHDIMVPTLKGSVSCQIGRDFAANRTVVSRFQFTLRRCYAGLDLASPYSDEKVGELTADGYFGPRTIAALKAVQRHIGTAADGIYGPNTRDRMRFLTPDRVSCYHY
ncbi:MULTISPECIES: peptidoglycan-binding domain-containing protein [Actinokineospora]|uniref:Peptidoglycan-binding protein n=1 Tax=Actinokineospora fastidiosa TaxID=1816 RepID=A0A918GFH8_9PSEU|nr:MULTISPECIES: peptidoglycan-binding domain-containing protein [Actinokineospora]UVS80282.1 Putative peptidoglycan binding domain protein [Actinokineospora sp. UTMC 2448]GGS34207.1 peptidoglycan-binding protein [Actinokineospora fastidiosa]